MEENKETPQENLSVLDEAKKLRDEIKAENDKRERILAQEQKLQAEKMLTSSAGQPTQPVVKIETAKEYADKVMTGKIKAE